MPYTPQEVADRMFQIHENALAEVKDACERALQEADLMLRREQQEHQVKKELLELRDAAVASLMKSLQECHSHIDQLHKDKKLLIKEKEVLKQRVAELEQRPEPLPHGLPELTRAALDQVRKWDSDVRVDKQRNTISSLGRDVKHGWKEIARLEDEIEQLRKGHGLQMCDVWAGAFESEERRPMHIWPWQQTERSLHDFLSNLRHEFLKEDHEEYEARQEEGDDDMEEGSDEED
jgi:chromosome segregation ATPase